MRLLFLAPYPPYPPRGGGQQRMYQLVRHTAREHEVWLLSFCPNGTASAALEPLRELCHVLTVPIPRHTVGKRLRTLVASSLPDMALRGRSSQFQQTLQQLLARVPFDVVQAESIEMAQYGMPAVGGPLWVYDAFNAEFVLQRRAFTTDLGSLRTLPVAAYSLAQWRKLHRYEQQLHRRCHGIFAVSADDAAILRQVGPQLPVSVVPNGVDTTFFAPVHTASAADAAEYILFTGTLDFRPNIDAVTWFSREVWPLVLADNPAARFVVVGRNPPAALRTLDGKCNIEIVGEVVDVRPYFAGAAAYVVPMRIGGGVRIKLLEALAMARPVVATSMGAEGIEGLEAGTHALLADDPAMFAAQIRAVLHDQQLSARLGQAGRALATGRYDWQALVPRMVATWQAWQAERRLSRRQ